MNKPEPRVYTTIIVGIGWLLFLAHYGYCFTPQVMFNPSWAFSSILILVKTVIVFYRPKIHETYLIISKKWFISYLLIKIY